MSTDPVTRKRTASGTPEVNGVLSSETEPAAKRVKPVPALDPDWKPSPFYAGGHYHLKLALLTLCRAHLNGYKVFLGQAVLDALPPSIDSYLLKYEDPNLQRWLFRLMHIRHRPFEEPAELTAPDFLTAGGRLNLMAYYEIYREMNTKNKWPSWNSLDRFVVLTHDRISAESLMSGDILLRQVEERDPLFDPAASAGGTQLQFYRFERLPVHFQKQVTETIGTKQLANEVVRHFLSNMKLALSNEIFFKFHYALVAEKVLAVSSVNGARMGNLEKAFLGKEFASPRARNFHQAMMKAIAEQDPNGKNWPTAKVRSIPASYGFGICKPDSVEILPWESGLGYGVDQFYQKFVIAASMPTEADLTRMVEVELGKIFTLIDGSIVFDRLWAWLQGQMPLQSGYHRCITVGKELLDDIHQKLLEWNLLGVMTSLPYKKLGLEGRYEFFTGELERLNTAIGTAAALIRVTTPHTSLAFMKLCQVLKWRSESDYATVDVRRIISFSTYALAAMKSRASYWLVVEMTPLNEEETTKAVQILRQLIYEALLVDGRCKKMVLIAVDGDPICDQVLHSKSHEVHRDEEVSFDGVDEHARTYLLECQVTFQKQLVRLGDLLPGGGSLEISGAMLNGLVGGEPVSVGKPLRLDNLRDTLAYYVPRKLQLYRRFDRECLGGDDLLVVTTGMSDREVLKIVAEKHLRRFNDGSWETAPDDVKVILFADVDTAETNFERVCAKFPKRTVHWFNVDGQFCALKKPSNGTRESELRRPLIKVITGPSGMGKSISLSSLAVKEKKLKPLHWVLPVNLPDFETLLIPGFDDLHAVVDFLCKASDLSETCEQKMLEHCLTHVGRAVLFLDGFDEIGLQARANVLQALRLLKMAKLEAVWLTTQTCHWPELEAELADYRYDLLPLTRLDHQTFLSKYWSARLKETRVTIEHQRMATSVQNFLRHVDDADNQWLIQWLNSPLQMQMLADIYWHDLQLVFVDAGNVLQLSTALPVDHLALCERYVEVKILQGLAVFGSPQTLQEDRAKFAEIHGRLAVVCLFTDEARKNGMVEPTVSDTDEEVLLGMKMLLKGDDGLLCYMHHAWAEYFVGRELGRMVGSSDGAEQVIAFLRDVYFAESFDSIRPFLDHLLTKGNRLNEAILCGDGDTVYEIVKGGSADTVKACDELGRTPLHLAALYSPDNAFLRLVSAMDEAEHKLDVGASDWMGFAPLCYALALVTRPPVNSDIPRHNLPILFLVQKASPDEITVALTRIMCIVDRRRTNREHIIKALTSLNDSEQLAAVADGLDFRRILRASGHRFDAVHYLLDMASERKRCKMLLADNCKLLRTAVASRSWAAFAWVAASLNGDALRTVEDAILKLTELVACFSNFATQHDLKGLAEMSRVLTARVRKELWHKVDYRDVFKFAVNTVDVRLVAEMLRLFGKDEELFTKTKCSKFFTALLKTPYRDGLFTWMLERVHPTSLRTTVLSALDYVTMFRTALLDGDRGVLTCLACCTDSEKLAMKRTVSPADCLRAFRSCLETRDNTMLQLLLRFVVDDEQQKVFAFLNVEVDGQFAFDLQPDMDGLWIAQICDDLDGYASVEYDWSVWAHLLYALLRLQIRTQK